MRVVSAANKYISETAPWKLGDDPDRQATVLHTALQVVDDAKTLLTPFLPHSSQQVFEALGNTGVWAARRRSARSPTCPTTWRASACRSRASTRCCPATTGPSRRPGGGSTSNPVGRWTKPTPLFTKLDPKLGDTGPDWAPISSDG